MRVLIVDDDPTTLMITQRRLKNRGHQVLTRTEALGTSAAIRAFDPRVVLIDVSMPALSGDRLTKVLTENRGDVRPLIVLFSDRPGTELRDLAMQCGAAGYFEKENAAELAAYLEQLVESD